MELTSWQKFCNRLLGRSLRNKARDNSELINDLARAKMQFMPEVYLATVVVTTFMIIAISVSVTAVALTIVVPWYESQQDPATVIPCAEWEWMERKYMNSAGIDYSLPGNGCPAYKNQVFPPLWLWGTRIGGFVLVPWIAWKTIKGGAKRQVKFRGRKLEQFLPYAASYTAAMSAANATPQKIFRSLAVNGDLYGEIAYDSSLIYRDITLLGYDLLTAINMAVPRAASPWMTEFMQGISGTLSSGGNLKLYFLNRAEHYMRENRTRLHEFIETLSMLAESYVVVAVAMPLFLIVMLVIMFWVSGSGSTMSEGFLYTIVMGVLPSIQIAYSFLVWLMSAEQKM